jgi:hypothetical protein
MILTRKFLSLGKKARGLNGKPVLFSKPVDRIIIHWIGPYSNQAIGTPWDWWENGNGTGVPASAHFIVKGKSVIRPLPLNEVGWHCGDDRNRHSIGIEVIPKNNSGIFANDTINTLKEVAELIREAHPGANLIERHYDGKQKKDCPRYYTPVTDMAGVEGRLANPKGGENRWIKLRDYLNGVS